MPKISAPILTDEQQLIRSQALLEKYFDKAFNPNLKKSCWFETSNYCFLNLYYQNITNLKAEEDLYILKTKAKEVAKNYHSLLRELGLIGVIQTETTHDELQEHTAIIIYLKLKKSIYDSMIKPITNAHLSIEESLAQLKLKLSQAQTQSSQACKLINTPSSQVATLFTQKNSNEQDIHKR
ncbi:hypothetical protein [Rickettsiales endosymbiont of Stachyamoeba lipophora]|uniref:hypothetical protein n=1 Tax=Rickettsiales endosymbiont of Stachyamoeba lipophora TaxID=2486578 RepID=UPI000F655073|nr:hypothetical protein [Rickettsiales endosymbiont of Stachyamoeba lipophora]AZL16040.1 hypothetical protein EF513_05760 [Rickettsiales endosymbiont of Stachyamoeba lipophora]